MQVYDENDEELPRGDVSRESVQVRLPQWLLLGSVWLEIDEPVVLHHVLGWLFPELRVRDMQ